MFSFFRRTFRQWGYRGARTPGVERPARRLQCESLEDRLVPSITTGLIAVNTTKVGVQSQSASATASNGSSVVVWTEVKNSRDTDIKAQRFDPAGNKVGGEMVIAAGRTPQHHPAVALDGSGSFVVVWVHNYSASDGDIHGALFRADGVRLGSEFVVTETMKNEFDPSVARAANGDFVISYTLQFGARDFDIKAIQFRANRSIARRIDVATSVYAEEKSRVAVAADGRFAVAYQSRGNVLVSRYSAQGLRHGLHSVATTARTESNPSLGMDNAGNLVVAWQEQKGTDWNILARLVSSTGKLGNVFSVSATSAAETLPSVAVDLVTGKSVIAYQSQTGSFTRLLVTEFTERQVSVRTSTMGSALSNAFVSVGGSSRRFLVTAQSKGRTNEDPDGGIVAVFGML